MSVEKVAAVRFYALIKCETFAMLGRVPMMWKDRVEKHIVGTPRYSGESVVAYSIGTRDVIRDEFLWIPEWAWDRADQLPKVQVRIDFDSLDEWPE